MYLGANRISRFVSHTGDPRTPSEKGRLNFHFYFSFSHKFRQNHDSNCHVKAHRFPLPKFKTLSFVFFRIRDCAIIIRRGVGQNMRFARRNITLYPSQQRRISSDSPPNLPKIMTNPPLPPAQSPPTNTVESRFLEPSV